VTPEWQALIDALRFSNEYLWIPLSRLIHYACERKMTPDAIGPAAFNRFAEAMKETCFRSKAEKTLRGAAKAWDTARASVPGWPDIDLGYKPLCQPPMSLPWCHFPTSLHKDAQNFVNPGAGDWLANDVRKPLRPAT
jgi:hypothetical protein